VASFAQLRTINPMLLFQKRFHDGIANGTIDLTYRTWTKPHVKPGGRYRCHPIGVIEVESITPVETDSITDQDAVRAGFGDHGELLKYMEQVGGDGERRVFRIEFRYGGDGDRISTALDTGLSDAEVESIAKKLAGFDERSANGPWTLQTLELIRKHPRVAASKLSAMVGREKLAFKADVVKLKKLGLTQSFEVGYEVSPRGLEWVARRKKKRSPVKSR
jgi:hypothetical protein